MSKKFKFTQRYATFLLSAFISVQVCSYTEIFAKQMDTVQSTSAVLTTGEAIEQNNARYLEVYFGIKNVPDIISWDFFGKAISKVSDKEFGDLSKEGTVQFLDAVKIAVVGSNFEELALTYSKEKIEDKSIIKNIEDKYKPYIACAMDTGLISEQDLSNIDISGAIGKDQVIDLLMAVADANGKTRNFLGYTNEEDIYGKLIKAREEVVLFENEKLQEIGRQVVSSGVTTGYNILNSSYNSNFIPELTLRYGHSTTTHAVQLIGLLNSEGIVAKVQLEPKTSIFQYLPEWGDVPPATPDYRVEVISEELMLAYSLEYDLVFEFENLEDKIRFNELIESYAKKNDDNLGDELLFASWWQPLYVSSVEVEEGYKLIYNNIVTDGEYLLNSFSVSHDKEEVLKGLKGIDESVEVRQVELWCNDAFYRYLVGESHQ